MLSPNSSKHPTPAVLKYTSPTSPVDSKKERPTCFSTDQPLRPVMPLTQIQTAHRDRTSQNGRRPASPWRRPPAAPSERTGVPRTPALGTARLCAISTPSTAASAKGPGLSSLFLLCPSPVLSRKVCFRHRSARRALPTGTTPLCPPAAGAARDTGQSARKNRPSPVPWGGFAECEVSVSVQRMEKARTPAARSPVFILRVGYGDSKKGWRRIPGASLFQFLGSVR